MANTRTSTKRARQALTRKAQNQITRSSTRTALRGAMDAIKKKDHAEVKTAYLNAVRALSKAASKGAIPKTRAARKISRLTLFIKKTLPAILPAQK
jgi:small subunit ribosomal protein S20